MWDSLNIKFCCGRKATRLKFVSGPINKIEPGTQAAKTWADQGIARPVGRQGYSEPEPWVPGQPPEILLKGLPEQH